MTEVSTINLIAGIAIALAVLVLLWLLLRGRGKGAAANETLDAPQPAAKAPPLEPVKPEIELAKPVTFTAPPEPVSVSVAPESTATAPQSADKPAVPPANGAPDNLLLIKGVGPKLNTLLGSLGITRFDQIAAWGDAEIAEVDRFLGTFSGRITRDSWVEQAALLAKGDHDGFAAKFGAVGG